MGKSRMPPSPEELINSYLKLRTATGNIAGGLGVLALLWCTVVLLGGFVSDLRLKDFWFLTVLSFIMASKFVNIYSEEFADKMHADKKPLYMEEAKMIAISRRQEWVHNRTSLVCTLVSRVLFVPKLILLCCFMLVAPSSPFVALGLSVERLARRNYGDAGGDAEKRAKLSAALDIFYVLVLVQSIFSFLWVYMVAFGVFVPLQAEERCGSETWASEVGRMYYSETARKLKTDGDLPDEWNLITYALGLLQSAASGDDDHLWGARVLDKLLCDYKDASVRQQLLSSRVAIKNLIRMIGRRGAADEIETRERAARILAHLASDLQITHFPGTLQCICSLLESCKQYSDKKGQHIMSLLETSQHQDDDAHMVLPIKDQTDHGHGQQLVISSPSAGLDKSRTRSSVYGTIGAKELISQAWLILEGLTRDEVNCAQISKHQALLSKITAPLSLSSHDFLRKMQDKKTDKVLSKSLAAVSRLLTSPGDGATRLRQELATDTEAVSNLMALLETDSGGAQELHEQALEILTELAFDDSFTKPALGGRSTCMLNKLFKNLVRIFLEEDNYTIAAGSDRGKATTRVRGKAGEALTRLLLLRTPRDANAEQDAIHLLTKVLNQILSSEMGTTTDAVKSAVKGSVTEMESLVTEVYNEKMGKQLCAKAVAKTQNQVAEEVINQILCSQMGTTLDAAKRAFTRNENLSTKVLDEILSSKMETVVDILRPLIQEIEKQSEERKFLAAILSVAVVICNENVISEEDFARATPEDAALVEKLKEILKLNKHSTTECFRVVKLTCQMVIAMIQVKPSCIAHFNEHNFKKELDEALETMSDIDECMLFAGNDRDEVIKPARSLASLVKEAQELLNTQHNNILTGISA